MNEQFRSRDHARVKYEKISDFYPPKTQQITAKLTKIYLQTTVDQNNKWTKLVYDRDSAV